MKGRGRAIFGWFAAIAIVWGCVHLLLPDRNTEPVLEFTILSATVNGRHYSKQANPDDLSSKYIVFQVDRSSDDDVVILPWSEITVSTRKYFVSEYVDVLESSVELIEWLIASDDTNLWLAVPEFLDGQERLISNLTPQQANLVHQEMVRRQQQREQSVGSTH